MKQSLGDRLEKKYSKYAISNLSMYMLICFAIGYILELLPLTQTLLDYMRLEPNLIVRGQIWRLVTWVVNVPEKDNIFFLLISLYFYYSIGKTLEMVWGDYRYNLYIFSGILYTVLGSFIVYFVLLALGYGQLPIGAYFTTYYVCMSIFLAFAATFPEMEVMLMFILPIKVKVLGIIYAIIMVVECVQSIAYGGLVGLLFKAIPMIASLLNFLIFFFCGRKRIGITRAQQVHRKEFKANVRASARAVTKHKCAICGKTDESHPNMEFRFCSKCNGNYEYCQDHLFTHNHIQ